MTNTELPAPLVEELARHQFESTSTHRNGIVTHAAACKCGVEFEWRTRFKDYEDHHLMAAYTAGENARVGTP